MASQEAIAAEVICPSCMFCRSEEGSSELVWCTVLGQKIKPNSTCQRYVAASLGRDAFSGIDLGTATASEAYAVQLRAHTLLAAGRSREGVATTLVHEGLGESDAALIVRAMSGIQEAARQAAGKRSMVIGAAVCGIAGLITAVTFAAAAGRGGGQYIIFRGALVFGGFMLVKGMYQYFTSSWKLSRLSGDAT